MGAHQGGLESPQVNQPKYLNHLPKPQYCKSRFYLPAEGTLTLMTSGEKGENGVFRKQLQKLEPTKGAWNHHNCLNHLSNTQSCKISCYLLAGCTLTLMTSEEKVIMGYFGNKLWNWGPPRGPGIAPSLSIIFPILNIAKADVIPLLKAH
jgi:hypothetical protein